MLTLKKALSFWIYIFYHLTGLVLYKIALKRKKFSKLLDYDKKSIEGYYRVEGKLFIWFQIVMTWLSLFYGFVDQDFFAFKFIISLWSFITVLRTIEYLEPNWIS